MNWRRVLRVQVTDQEVAAQDKNVGNEGLNEGHGFYSYSSP